MKMDDIKMKYVTHFFEITLEGDNQFTHACRNKEDMSVIKYILNDLEKCKKIVNVNIHHVTKDNENGFTLACRYGDVVMIKYFASDLNININHKNNNGHDGLMIAIINNIDIDVIKYLINDLKMDVNCIDKY
jgi:hypothetical protein